MSPAIPRRIHVGCRLAVTLAIATLVVSTGVPAQEAKAPEVDQAPVNRAAEIVFAREVNRALAKKALDVSQFQVSLARRTAAPLISTADSFAPEAGGWVWSIHVETRDEPVAYCLPGGKIMLSTGLFERTKLSPPELGVVLAHVIAHALAGHDAATAAARLASLREVADPNRRVLQLADILGKIVLNDPHDQRTEREADAMALELMARAGVDPQPAVETWRKIARAGGATPPGFLALHPPWPGRIEEIEAQMPAALARYEQARAEHAARAAEAARAGEAARPRPPAKTRP